MTIRKTSLLAALTAALAVACSGGSSGGSREFHASVPLLDVQGQPIALGSTEPYSPRQTCGACHDVDEIANGYHFQQGRTDAAGNVIAKDDYFADGRTFVRSPGMYGKW